MNVNKTTWRSAFASYLDRRAFSLLFLGFSAGLPLLLIFSSLSLWLREAGIDRGTVTLFSWAALAYSFKFVWAPLVDLLPLPWLTRYLGRRRSWLLLAQCLVMLSIIAMGAVDPAQPGSLLLMAIFAVFLGFSSASQDIVIDAYRIEVADVRMQSVLSACYTAGYRLGMIVAGAGALYLATWYGAAENSYNYMAWRYTYWTMSLFMLLGVFCTLLMPEPKVQREVQHWASRYYLHLVLVFVFLSCVFVISFYYLGVYLAPFSLTPLLHELLRIVVALLLVFVGARLAIRWHWLDTTLAKETWVEPATDFFFRYGKKALLILALVGLYRISDIVSGVISNVFYQDMGFSKNEIATAVKTVGVVVTILGGFIGGLLAQRYAIMKMLFVGGLLSCTTNLLYVLLAHKGYDLFYLYIAVISDNLAAGLASAVFIAFLSSLTNVRFTAVQYAIFSSLMTLFPKILGGYSGTMVNAMGYPLFFTLTALLGIPVLFLVYLTAKRLSLD